MNAQTAIRIGIVTETYAPEVNGVAMTLQRFVRGLGQLGHCVDLVRPRQTRDDRPSINGVFTEHLIQGMTIPFYRQLRFGFPAGRALREKWSRERPDVVYVATEGPLGRSAVTAARACGIPVVSGFHTNFPAYCRHYHIGAIEPVVMRYLRRFHLDTACTLAPTRELVDSLRGNGFGRLDVLPRGVDSELFNPSRRDPSLRTAWGAGPDSCVVLYVGRIAAEKNIELMIDSCRAIRARVRDVKVVLVGDGPLKESLQRQHPDMLFVGVRKGEELATYYASADVLLFPSLTETFGNVTLEGMASGLAVVAFDYASGRMHIRHADNGMLAPTDQAEQFTEHAARLCADAELRGSVGRAARAHAESIHWDRVTQRFADLLTQHVTPGAA